MENFINSVGIEKIILFVLIFNVVLLIGFIINIIKTNAISKKYKNFMQKLGEGKNIEEDLENYMYKVESIEIAKFIEQLDKDFEKSIQKVGIIRYNAYKDTGSDLSFTLALLDENNNGVVLNGIYSREMSNIYAKPIENGKSTYTLSDEEQKAIERAINSTKSGR